MNPVLPKNRIIQTIPGDPETEAVVAILVSHVAIMKSDLLVSATFERAVFIGLVDYVVFDAAMGEKKKD
jgi:hypothetical protein